MAKHKTTNTDPSLPLPNGKWEIFAIQVAAGSPASTAYGRAGFKAKTDGTRRTEASKLLAKPNIAARVEFLKNQHRQEVVTSINLSKEDILRWTIEQHERNIGARLVTHKLVAKTGKQKGKVIEVTVSEYDGKAAAGTLKLLHDEFGLGLGGSGSRTGDLERMVRGGINSPEVIDAFDRIKRARQIGLTVVGSSTTAGEVPKVKTLAELAGIKQKGNG